MKKLVKSVKDRLYDLICSGVGDGETIQLTAEKIVESLRSSNKKRIERFEAAVRAHEMIGSMPPNDHELIQKEYEAAKAALIQ